MLEKINSLSLPLKGSECNISMNMSNFPYGYDLDLCDEWIKHKSIEET